MTLGIDAATTLSHSQLFHGIPREMLVELAEVGTLTRSAAGTALLQEGDRVPGLWVILEGFVQIRKGGQLATAPLGRGNFFGEIAVFGLAIEATATVEAPQGATALLLPQDKLGGWFKKYPDAERVFLRHLAAELCRRLHLTTDRLSR